SAGRATAIGVRREPPRGEGGEPPRCRQGGSVTAAGTAAQPPNVGDRVTTPDGPGVVVGWHSSRTWAFGRLEQRAYLLVDLDAGSRRLYPTARLKLESPAA